MSRFFYEVPSASLSHDQLVLDLVRRKVKCNAFFSSSSQFLLCFWANLHHVLKQFVNHKSWLLVLSHGVWHGSDCTAWDRRSLGWGWSVTPGHGPGCLTSPPALSIESERPGPSPPTWWAHSGLHHLLCWPFSYYLFLRFHASLWVFAFQPLRATLFCIPSSPVGHYLYFPFSKDPSYEVVVLKFWAWGLESGTGNILIGHVRCHCPKICQPFFTPPPSSACP